MCQGSCKRDVVDVVTSRLPIHSFLTPASHTSKDQLGIACKTNVRANAKSLHNPWTESFNDRISFFDELQKCFYTLGIFQINRNVFASPLQEIKKRSLRCRSANRLSTINANDLCAHICQHHRSKRPRSDAGNFYNSITTQRTSHDDSLFNSCLFFYCCFTFFNSCGKLEVPLDMRGDGINQYGPKWLRHIVPHVGEQ